MIISSKISFYIFVVSIIINIPIILSRQIKKYEFQFEDRKLNVYEHQARYFFSYHFIIVFLANCVRDIIPLIIEIIINIYLTFTIVDYNKKRQALGVQNQKININNSRIAILLCFFSSLLHCFTFSLIILFRFADTKIYVIFSFFVSVFYSIKHSINFVIFFFFNEKFRTNFKRLIPKWMKNKKFRT